MFLFHVEVERITSLKHADTFYESDDRFCVVEIFDILYYMLVRRYDHKRFVDYLWDDGWKGFLFF